MNKLERQILYNRAYVWNLENNGINAFIGKAEIVANRKQTRGYQGGPGTNWEIEIDVYTLLCIKYKTNEELSFPGGSEGKASASTAGDLGLVPGSGRSPGEGNGNPLQHSCLENPTDGGDWWAIVHGVAKSQT